MGAAAFDAMNRENRLAQEAAAQALPVTEAEPLSDTVTVRVLQPDQVNSELGVAQPGDLVTLSLTAASQLVALGIAEVAEVQASGEPEEPEELLEADEAGEVQATGEPEEPEELLEADEAGELPLQSGKKKK